MKKLQTDAESLEVEDVFAIARKGTKVTRPEAKTSIHGAKRFGTINQI